MPGRSVVVTSGASNNVTAPETTAGGWTSALCPGAWQENNNQGTTKTPQEPSP